MGVRSAMIVDAATVAQDQPRPRRNSPAKICHEVPCGRQAAQRQRHQQDHSPGDQDGRPAEAVGGPADERREGEHAEHVDRDDEPDDLEVRAAVLHVQRRHDHHGHHRRVGAGHRRPPPPRPPARRAPTAAKRPHDRPRGSGPRAGHDPGRLLGEEQRVGSQPHRTHPAATTRTTAPMAKPAGQLGHAHGAGDARSDAGEVGAGDGADRWSPTRRPTGRGRGAPRSPGRWRRSATRC